MNTQNLSQPSLTKPSLLKAWIVCISAALFFSYELMQMHMLNAIAPMLMKDLNITGTLFGYLCASYLFADVIFLIPAGIILDRYSPRKVILSALMICIVGTVFFALSQNFLQAALAHFLSGIGNAFCFLSCMMFVSRWFEPKKQAFAIGVVVTLGMLGGVIAQSPFSLLAQSLGWKEAMLCNALIGGVIFLIIYAFVQDAPLSIKETKDASKPILEQLKKALSNPQTILAGLYTGLVNLPLMVLGAMWGSLFLTQVHHISLASASLITSMICMGTIVGSSAFGFASDQLGKAKSLMFIGALMSLLSVCLILFCQTSSAPLLTLLFFLLGFFSSSQVLGYPLITQNSPKDLVGTSMGVAAVIIMGLAAIMQPLSGVLLDIFWDHTVINGTPVYKLQDFLACLSILPIGLFISVTLVRFLKESVLEKQTAS